MRSTKAPAFKERRKRVALPPRRICASVLDAERDAPPVVGIHRAIAAKRGHPGNRRSVKVTATGGLLSTIDLDGRESGSIVFTNRNSSRELESSADPLIENPNSSGPQ